MTLIDIILVLIGSALGAMLFAPLLPHSLPAWAVLPLGILLGIIAVPVALSLVGLCIRKTMGNKPTGRPDSDE